MKRLQGEEGKHIAGSAFTRDSTRGQSDVVFPSAKEGEVGEAIQPLICEWCGLQFGFGLKSEKPKNFYPSHAWIEFVWQRYIQSK